MSTPRRLIIGCGYLGQPLAVAWRDSGDAVITTTRSPERARQFEQSGFQGVVLDVTAPEALRNLPPADTVVFSVGFDPSTDHSRHDVYAQGLKNVLEHLPRDVRRLIFISTTGVYGDAGGGTVDENTPCDPARPGGQAFLAAEQILQSDPHWSTRGTILRLAGIYGPGRVPRSADIRDGRPIPAARGGALNLIHVEDAVQAIQKAADAETVSPIYIVSDGHPVDRRDYYREVARLLDAPEPTFEDPDPDTPAAKRAQADRQMSNQRLVEDLGFVPRYPSYREGLAAIL